MSQHQSSTATATNTTPDESASMLPTLPTTVRQISIHSSTWRKVLRTDTTGGTTFHNNFLSACRLGNASAVRSHLTNAHGFADFDFNINYTDHHGWNALSLVAFHGHDHCLFMLLNAGATVDSLLPTARMTPLIAASIAGNSQCLLLLLLAGANVNTPAITAANVPMDKRDKRDLHVDYLHNTYLSSGCTAALAAAAFGHSNILSILIDNGANISTSDCYNCSAVMLASRGGHLQCLEILLAAQPVNVLDYDHHHQNAIFHATNHDRHQCLHRLLQVPGLDYLSASGDDRDRHGNLSPILVATLHGFTMSLTTLLAAGADVNSTLAGRTLVMLACEGNFVDCLIALVSAGADITKKSHWLGRTALHFAADLGHLECLTVLISSGADVHVLDSTGMTSEHLAVKGGHTEVMHILVKAAAAAVPSEISFSCI